MDVLAETLATLNKVLTDQQLNQNSRGKKTVEVSEGELLKSILNAWEDIDFDTLRVLSVNPRTQDYDNVTVPSLSDYVTNLTDRQTKLAQTVSTLVNHAHREQWLAFPSKFMIVIILRFGYMHPQIQMDNTMGFSCLMMKPEMSASYRHLDTRELQGELNQMFGNGDLSKEFLAGITKADIHIPGRVEEAIQQVEGAISFWRLMTSKDGFAASAYLKLRTFISGHVRTIRLAQNRDQTTLTRLLHTADVIFQRSTARIRRLRVQDVRQRISETLRRSYDEGSEAMWEQILEHYPITNSLHHLALPGNLEELQHHRLADLVQSEQGVLRQRRARAPLPGGRAPLPGGSDNESDPEPRGNPTVNPNVRPEFQLPEGTVIRRAFPPALREQFPRVRFARSQRKGNRSATPCLRFLCLGRCATGTRQCVFSHLQPSNMEPAGKDRCVEIIAQARASL